MSHSMFTRSSSQQNAYLNYDPWVVHKDYINNLLCTLREEYVLYAIGLLQFSCIL